MENKNNTRIFGGLQKIQPLLKDFVKKTFKDRFGDTWIQQLEVYNVRLNREDGYTDAKTPEEVFDSQDLSSLIHIITRKCWKDVFQKTVIGRNQSYLTAIKECRNQVSHSDGSDIDDETTARAFETMALLCDLICPEKSEDFRKILREVRYTDQEESSHLLAERARRAQAKREREALHPDFAQGLPAWRNVIEPNADVARGRYKKADFAANLADVADGSAPQEYLDPVDFFHRTYVTHGIKNLLVQAIRRVAGLDGDPVIQLKTSFGGGKTHTMLALYHLMRKMVPVSKMRGMPDVLKEAGVDDYPKVNVAVIVGTALDASKSKMPSHLPGIKINTIWGEIGAQLAYAAGDLSLYDKYIKESDKKSVSPGSEALRKFFDACGPCMVLIDELVAYARKIYGKTSLPAGTYDNLMTFVQELTEAAKASKNSLVIASIPESDEEIGGESGQKALSTIEKYFGRIESVWNPVEANESFEIVRRRLFKSCDDEQQVDLICRQFAVMYDAQKKEFPQEVQTRDYVQKLKKCYPIHPAIFDTLYNTWTQIENFQRTRGVLRFMAGVVHYLWQIGDRSPMIMPWAIPFCDSEVSAELIKYLSEGQVWQSIIHTQVDGNDSKPTSHDKEDSRFGQLGACRRIMRAIMFTTSPTKQRQKACGLSLNELHLCVMMPGESASVYDDAISKLEDSLSNLYSSPDHLHYWIDTRPTLRKEMLDRMEKIDDDKVQEWIAKNLKLSGSEWIKNIHKFPSSTWDVPDTCHEGNRLIVLPLKDNYSARDNYHQKAQNAASEFLCRHGNTPRMYKNTLLFLVPDNQEQSELAKAVKELIAWASIEKDSDILNLGAAEVHEVQQRRQCSEKAVDRKINETYKWLIYPTQERKREAPIQWEVCTLGGQNEIKNDIPRKLEEREAVLKAWSPRFLNDILTSLYFGDEREYLDIKSLWQDLEKYCYMPKLVDREVLFDCVKKGVKDGMFGYANSVVEDTSGEFKTYHGLESRTDAFRIDPDGGMIVKQSAVDAQRQREKGSVTTEGTGRPDGGQAFGASSYGTTAFTVPSRANPSTGQGTRAQAPALKTRFRAIKKIDASKFLSDLSPAVLKNIFNEILINLQDNTKNIEISLDIEATAEDGFQQEVESAVEDNAKAMGFKASFDG